MTKKPKRQIAAQVKKMKFVSWNIRHGGTKSKLEAICDQLAVWDADVVGLSEFRASETSQAIAKALEDLGLIHQATTQGAPDRGRNFLCLASKFPIEIQPSSGLLAKLGRCLHAQIQGIDVMLMHIPNRSDEKWEAYDEVIETFSEIRSRSAVCFGDTNSGQRDVDDENQFFNQRESNWFERINNAGWIDVWRNANPDAREFTWYSNHGNGFRLDQVFAPASFVKQLTAAHYDWGKGSREARLSDHAAIVFDLALDCGN